MGDITFDLEGDTIIGIGPPGKEAIRDYVDVLSDTYHAAVAATDAAIHNFETSMSNASTKDANPDILGSMLSSAIDTSISSFIKGVGKHLPAVPVAFSVFKALSKELKRANNAANSIKVRDFIIGQREQVAKMRDQFNRPALIEEVRNEFNAVQSEDDTIESLHQKAQQIINNTHSVELQNACEQRLWEQWINAHFAAFTKEAFGCIEVTFRPESDGASLISVKIAMPGSSRGKITDALTRIMNKRASIRSPLNFKVTKRIKFIDVENLVGGSQTDFGWLDASNHVIHEPFFDDARRVFNDPGWKNFIRKFK